MHSDVLGTGLRVFAGEVDLNAMLALSRASAAGNLHVVDLPYRLSSWALDDPHNVGLWFDTEGRLLAWAVMQTPFWAIDYAFAPGAESHLHRQVLAWADQRAREMLVSPDGHPCWFVNVFSDQSDPIHELDAAGYACQADVGQGSWSKVLLHRPAHLPVAAGVLPPGFAIRPLAGGTEIEAYGHYIGRCSRART